MIQAIAIGTGPSFFRWIQNGPFPSVPRFGCGKCTHYMSGLDYYYYADTIHQPNLPDIPEGDPDFHPTAMHHPNCKIYAHNRRWKPGWNRWPEGIPHGGNSGGGAISLACTLFDHIGLVGFDTVAAPAEFIAAMHKDIFSYWQNRGKTFYSLVPMDCAFNNRLKSC